MQVEENEQALRHEQNHWGICHRDQKTETYEFSLRHELGFSCGKN
jgi:hypothetical protein